MEARAGAGLIRDERAPSLAGLGKAVVGLLGLVIVANLVALVADLEQLDLLQGLRDGERVGFQQLQDSDDRVATAGILQGAAYVVCGIGFLCWYGRAFRNVERLGARGIERSRAWAIVSWFIPFANLVVPKRVMNQIWRASDPERPAEPVHWQENSVPALFHWWWGLWLISSVVGNILLRESLDAAATAEEAVAIATRYVAFDVVDLLPAVLAIIVVWKTTERQERRRVRFVNGQLPVLLSGPSAQQPRPEYPAPTG